MYSLNLPISSNKKELLSLSTSGRVSLSKLSKTWLVKCSKMYSTILLTLLHSTSNFVYFEWTNAKINRNCSHFMNPLNNRILKDMDRTYIKISILHWHRSFARTSLIIRSTSLAQSAGRDKKENTSKPQAAIRMGISANGIFFENRKAATNIR